MMGTGLMTVDQFCRKHSVSVATVYRAVNSGALRFTKIGASSRIAPEHEKAWLDSLPVVSGALA